MRGVRSGRIVLELSQGQGWGTQSGHCRTSHCLDTLTSPHHYAHCRVRRTEMVHLRQRVGFHHQEPTWITKQKKAKISIETTTTVNVFL